MPEPTLKKGEIIPVWLSAVSDPIQTRAVNSMLLKRRSHQPCWIEDQIENVLNAVQSL